jgi:hypothetical protein
MLLLGLLILSPEDLVWAKEGSSTTPPSKSSLGIILGEPSGLTGKFWTAQDRAIDAGLAFSFNSFFLVYSDYLFHFYGSIPHSDRFMRTLDPYVGVGGEFFFSEGGHASGNHYFDTSDSSFGLGIRVPLGAEWFIPRAPLGIFVELVPGLGVIPGTFGFLQGGIGARYYF